MTALAAPPVDAPNGAPGAQDASRPPRRPRGKSSLGLLIFAIAAMAFSLIPFYWLVNTSLKDGSSASDGQLFPSSPTLSNYAEALSDPNFLLSLRNSVIVASSATIIAIIFASFAAYALARLRLRRKGLILTLVLSVTTFPTIAIAAPMFSLWTDIGLYDTLPGLIIPKLTFALPMAIYILTSFFREIPKELEESAYMDGASPFQAFYKIILPLAVPGIATTSILVFILCWNEFLLPITLTTSADVRTVPVAISFFSGSTEFEQPLGTISAASVLVTIPLVIVVLIFQKRIISGLTSGSLKG